MTWRDGSWQSAMTPDDSPRPDPTSLEDAILATLNSAGHDRTLSATDIAHAIARDADWHTLLGPIRRAAVDLGLAGRLVIYRKGKPVDPADFKGVYRLGLPRHD
jgi:hypothetical protein